jgi:hypothetical protein
MATLLGSKRRRSGSTPVPASCFMCETASADIEVGLPMGRKVVKTPLCWLHYYTSRAVRETRVKLLREEEEPIVPDHVQTLFSEAFVELQQELAEEAARAFQSQKKDPLGIINSFRGTRKAPPPKPKPLRDYKDAGGFLRDVPLPERFQRTQQQQQQQQADGYGNPYQRRKGSGKSIWNMALDKTQKSVKASMAESYHSTSTCTCGSTNVATTGNVTNRNNDMRKGETWGVKDGPNVVMRYQCQMCGKTWNEEE